MESETNSVNIDIEVNDDFNSLKITFPENKYLTCILFLLLGYFSSFPFIVAYIIILFPYNSIIKKIKQILLSIEMLDIFYINDFDIRNFY
jgi:hypothetical protein